MRLVASGIAVAALPKSLADPLVDAGDLRIFDPGWVPDPLLFTASFVADPPSQITETAAQIALVVAERHANP
mgnify:CR=1 FL=1